MGMLTVETHLNKDLSNHLWAALYAVLDLRAKVGVKSVELFHVPKDHIKLVLGQTVLFPAGAQV